MKRERVQIEKRAYELDLIRGIAILLMIFDHFMNDVYDVMPFIFADFPGQSQFWRSVVILCSKYWNWGFRTAMHYFVCFFFLAITGICCTFSRSNLMRGLKLMGFAIGLSLVTYIIGYFIGDLDFTICFGVLHCMALTLIIYGLIEKLVKSKWFYLIIGVLFTIVGAVIEWNYVGISYYGNNFFVILLKCIIGFEQAGADCFPFILNGGQIFIGIFLGKQFYSEKKSVFQWEYKNNPISFVGRYSLWVYFAHQIIIPVVLGLVLIVCGFHITL